MKLSNNRYKILEYLYPGKKGHDCPLSAPQLRIRMNLSPMKLMEEIRALINLILISTHGDGIYRITAAGKAALMKAGEKESYGDGEMKELFK